MIVTNPPNVNLSQINIDGDLVMGAHAIDSLKFLFGDGSDGDVTSSGDIDLSTVMLYDNLTIQNGHTLKTTSKTWLVIFVKDTLTIDAGGEITTKGRGGAGGAGGAAAANPGSQGTAGVYGGTGGAGGAGCHSGPPWCNAGSAPRGGGSGGGAGVSAGGDGGDGINGTGSQLNIDAFDWLYHKRNNTVWGSGGSGGGGGQGVNGGAGGAGGVGGGMLIIIAKKIINNGGINSDGNDGVQGSDGTVAHSGGGGGGGGDGGLLFIKTESFSGNAITVSGGAGGAGGAGVGGANDGCAGGAGAAGQKVIVE